MTFLLIKKYSWNIITYKVNDDEVKVNRFMDLLKVLEKKAICLLSSISAQLSRSVDTSIVVESSFRRNKSGKLN